MHRILQGAAWHCCPLKNDRFPPGEAKPTAPFRSEKRPKPTRLSVQNNVKKSGKKIHFPTNKKQVQPVFLHLFNSLSTGRAYLFSDPPRNEKKTPPTIYPFPGLPWRISLCANGCKRWPKSNRPPPKTNRPASRRVTSTPEHRVVCQLPPGSISSLSRLSRPSARVPG